MSNFNEISKRYSMDSVVQKSAGEILLSLCEPKEGEMVLDLGCGNGKMSEKIYKKTKPKP